MTEIYFDNSATTRVCPEAAETALRTMTAGYGNPSSVHHMGAAAARELASARQTIADCLKASPGEVSFLSCGTEANNTVLFGASQLDPKRRRILVSAVEHPSVQQPAKYLLSKGYDVYFLPVDEQGRVRLDATAELLDEHTALISVMQVNNETGAVQPLKDIGALVREKAPQALFHVDGVQAFCRLPAELKLWQADAYSMSGHKIHAPKGIGALWLRSGRRIPPLLLGGGQEKGFRSGTEAMPNIMAFAAAARIAHDGMAGYAAQMQGVKHTLLQELQSLLPQVKVNGPAPDESAPHIVNLSFPGCRSEVLLHYLEEKGVYVSAGSACDSRSSKGSPVLTAMGLEADIVDSALRFSFSRFNTENEAREAAHIIAAAVEEVSFFMSKTHNRKRK